MANKIVFPDNSYRGISTDMMAKLLGPRVTLLDSSHGLDEKFFEIDPHIEYDKLGVDHPFWCKMERVCKLGQHEPLWLLARKMKSLVSASSLGALLGFYDTPIGKQLDLPTQMIRKKGGININWDDLIIRSRYPHLPSLPLDSIMGHTFTEWGKCHENNATVCFMVNNPSFHYRDQGLTILTPRILIKANLTNRLTGQKITSLKFLIGASPDGIVTYRDPVTGELIEANVEWKAGTAYKPKTNDYEGAEFFFDRKALPYKKVKAYYVPQAQLQMLVCEKDHAYWGAWSDQNGMRVWYVRYSKDYIELMFTVLIYIQETFGNIETPVPVAYFTDICPNPAMRAIHKQLVALTLAIIEEQRPDISVFHAEYKDTQAPTDMAFQASEIPLPRQKRISVPNFPPEMPAFARLGLLTDTIFDNKQVKWVTDPRKIDDRYANMQTLMSVPYLQFASPIVSAIISGCKEVRPLTLAVHPNERMYRCLLAESYLVSVATLYYDMCTSFPSLNSQMSALLCSTPVPVDAWLEKVQADIHAKMLAKTGKPLDISHHETKDDQSPHEVFIDKCIRYMWWLLNNDANPGPDMVYELASKRTHMFALIDCTGPINKLFATIATFYTILSYF